jgi:hypothetical protein
MSAIREHLNEQLTQREQVIIRTLAYVGETCIREARTEGNYKDQTGNLRGSIGSILAKDGHVVQVSGFEQGAAKRKLAKGEKRDGGKRGERFARELAGRFPNGIVLILVAGMPYSAPVAASGKDVLDSAEATAEIMVPQLMKQLGFTKR